MNCWNFLRSSMFDRGDDWLPDNFVLVAANRHTNFLTSIVNATLMAETLTDLVALSSCTQMQAIGNP